MPKIIYPVLILLLYLTNDNCCQVYNISGTISSGNAFVSNALVTFINQADSMQYTAITDTSGYYNISVLTGIKGNNVNPSGFELSQNYPNPFSNSTTIQYKLNEQSRINLVIYDILGQEVRRFNLGDKFSGIHSLAWDGKNNFGELVSPGIYIYQLVNGNERLTRKLMYGAESSIQLRTTTSSFRSNHFIKDDVQESSQFRIEIKNIKTTKPQIIDSTISCVSVNCDTVINVIVRKVAYPDFAIYFLKDSTLKFDNILDTDLSQLELAESPWLSIDNIKLYDWSSHLIFLKEDFCSFPDFSGSKWGYWSDKPWIVSAGNIPCYAGYFRSLLSSKPFYPGPLITELELRYGKDVLISNWNQHGLDIRDNSNVKSVLEQHSIYHGGIELSFDTSNVPVSLINSDTAAIEYSICIKNNDTDDLYVFDPGKVSNNILYYYNNGPQLISEKGIWISSEYKNTAGPHAWDSTWYSLLKSGESITRKLKLGGYPFISPGKYTVWLRYDCPIVDKSRRYTNEGRYWFGKLRPITIQLEVQ